MPDEASYNLKKSSNGFVSDVPAENGIFNLKYKELERLVYPRHHWSKAFSDEELRNSKLEPMWNMDHVGMSIYAPA
jgi:hypothetical protein